MTRCASSSSTPSSCRSRRRSARTWSKASTREQEAIIINNIQRIANVPGLTVRVKFPAPTVITTSTYIKSTGDYIAADRRRPRRRAARSAARASPRPPRTRTTSTRPADLEPKPQQNTTETVTTTEDTTIPEKIFLYGDIAGRSAGSAHHPRRAHLLPLHCQFSHHPRSHPAPHADPLHADHPHHEQGHRRVLVGQRP